MGRRVWIEAGRGSRGVKPAVAVGLLAAALATAGCSSVRPTADPHPLLILVSFDGFRWDYQERFETPALDRLAAAGVRAERLIAAFPTKTIPSSIMKSQRSRRPAPRGHC